MRKYQSSSSQPPTYGNPYAVPKEQQQQGFNDPYPAYFNTPLSQPSHFQQTSVADTRYINHQQSAPVGPPLSSTLSHIDPHDPSHMIVPPPPPTSLLFQKQQQQQMNNHQHIDQTIISKLTSQLLDSQSEAARLREENDALIHQLRIGTKNKIHSNESIELGNSIQKMLDDALKTIKDPNDQTIEDINRKFNIAGDDENDDVYQSESYLLDICLDETKKLKKNILKSLRDRDHQQQNQHVQHQQQLQQPKQQGGTLSLSNNATHGLDDNDYRLLLDEIQFIQSQNDELQRQLEEANSQLKRNQEIEESYADLVEEVNSLRSKQHITKSEQALKEDSLNLQAKVHVLEAERDELGLKNRSLYEQLNEEKNVTADLKNKYTTLHSYYTQVMDFLERSGLVPSSTTGKETQLSSAQ